MTADLDGSQPGGGPWVLGMRWSELLFAHWRIPIADARRLIPEPLEPDLFDGEAWLGVVPFLMSRVRPRLVPPIPPISRFPELNVRTYARYGGRSGVWFLSLDAAGRVGVTLGRRAAGLPYHHARMRLEEGTDGWIAVQSIRSADPGRGAELTARYRPTGPAHAPDALTTFLTARDGLWTLDRHGRPRWLAIRHAAWPLQPAEADITRATITDPHGIALTLPPEHLAFSRTVDVEAWRPRRLPE